MIIYQAYYKTNKGFSVEFFTVLKDARNFCNERESLIIRKEKNEVKYLSTYNNWIPCDLLMDLLNEEITDESIHYLNLHIKTVENRLSNIRHKWNLY